MQKIDSSGTRNYITDGDSPAAAVLSDGLATFTPGLSERRSSTSSFYHGDALGSTRSQTNSSQSVTDTKRYDAFGMLIASSGSNPTPFGFVGGSQYQTDADSGLLLLGHRYYDASIGRFISRDPAYAGTNYYAYCENKPINCADPTGEDQFSFGLCGLSMLSPWAVWGDINLIVDIPSFNHPSTWGLGHSYHYGGGVGIGAGAGLGLNLGWDPHNLQTGDEDGCVVGMIFEIGIGFGSQLNFPGYLDPKSPGGSIGRGLPKSFKPPVQPKLKGKGRVRVKSPNPWLKPEIGAGWGIYGGYQVGHVQKWGTIGDLVNGIKRALH